MDGLYVGPLCRSMNVFRNRYESLLFEVHVGSFVAAQSVVIALCSLL